MSKRVILSIIFILLGIGAVLLERGTVGGLIGAFFFVMMLLLWAIPGYATGEKKHAKGPGWKRLALAFLSIGVGLFGSLILVWILPPQVFPWVLIAVGIGVMIWFFKS